MKIYLNKQLTRKIIPLNIQAASTLPIESIYYSTFLRSQNYSFSNLLSNKSFINNRYMKYNNFKINSNSFSIFAFNKIPCKSFSFNIDNNSKDTEVDEEYDQTRILMHKAINNIKNIDKNDNNDINEADSNSANPAPYFNLMDEVKLVGLEELEKSIYYVDYGKENLKKKKFNEILLLLESNNSDQAFKKFQEITEASISENEVSNKSKEDREIINFYFNINELNVFLSKINYDSGKSEKNLLIVDLIHKYIIKNNILYNSLTLNYLINIYLDLKGYDSAYNLLIEASLLNIPVDFSSLVGINKFKYKIKNFKIRKSCDYFIKNYITRHYGSDNLKLANDLYINLRNEYFYKKQLLDNKKKNKENKEQSDSTNNKTENDKKDPNKSELKNTRKNNTLANTKKKDANNQKNQSSFPKLAKEYNEKLKTKRNKRNEQKLENEEKEKSSKINSPSVNNLNSNVDNINSDLNNKIVITPNPNKVNVKKKQSTNFKNEQSNTESVISSKDNKDSQWKLKNTNKNKPNTNNNSQIINSRDNKADKVDSQINNINQSQNQDTSTQLASDKKEKPEDLASKLSNKITNGEIDSDKINVDPERSNNLQQTSAIISNDQSNFENKISSIITDLTVNSSESVSLNNDTENNETKENKSTETKIATKEEIRKKIAKKSSLLRNNRALARNRKNNISRFGPITNNFVKKENKKPSLLPLIDILKIKKEIKKMKSKLRKQESNVIVFFNSKDNDFKPFFYNSDEDSEDDEYNVNSEEESDEDSDEEE